VRLQLLEILYKRKDAFVKSASDLKAYNTQEFELNLKPTSRSAIQKKFRHKPEHANMLHYHTDVWDKQGIVTASNDYNWNSPIFLVPKSALRDATDNDNPAQYRRVRGCNALLLKHVMYTIAIIEEIVKYSEEEPPQRAKYFSTFDSFQGSMQIKLKEGLS